MRVRWLELTLACLPSPRCRIAVLLVVCALSGLQITLGAHAAPGDHFWSIHFGNDANQHIQSIATDHSGNSVAVGDFYGSVDFGGGVFTNSSNDSGNDGYVAKFDANGNHVWSRALGGSGWQEPRHVATDASDNVLVAGTFWATTDFGGGPVTAVGAADVFVVRYDADGNYVWGKQFGGTEIASITSIAVDGPGNVAIGGTFRTTLDLGGGTLVNEDGFQDLFLAKYDAAGTHVWSKRFGDGPDAGMRDGVVFDGTGNVILAASFVGAIDFGGGQLTSTAPFDTDIALAKFNSAGTHLWSSRYAGADEQHSMSVATSPSGDIWLAADVRGDVNFGGGTLTSTGLSDNALAKFGPTGVHMFSRLFGSEDYDDVWDLSVDGGGLPVIVGRVRAPVDFGGGPILAGGGFGDAYVAQFSASGTHIWSAAYGDSNEQHAFTVAIDNADDVIVGTWLRGSADFGGGSLSTPGDVDIAIAKLEGARDPSDDDGDGCAAQEEWSSVPAVGGKRDPSSPWDFFDVPAPAGPAVGVNGRPVLTPTSFRNKAISLQDVGVVLAYVGRVAGTIDYDADRNLDGDADGVQLDRTASTVPGEMWHSGPPDGAISLVDVGIVLPQIGHSCIAAP